MQLSMDEITCGYPNAKKRLGEQMTGSLTVSYPYADQAAYCLMCLLLQNSVGPVDAIVSFSPAGYWLAKALARLEKKEHLAFPDDDHKGLFNNTAKKVVLVAGPTVTDGDPEHVIIERLRTRGIKTSAVVALIDYGTGAGDMLNRLAQCPVCSVFTIEEFLNRSGAPDRKIVTRI